MRMIGALIVGVWALAGCGRTNPSVPCSAASDCPAGDVCDLSSQTCMATTGCGTCPMDTTCMGGSCQPIVGSCANVSCPAGASCLQGNCVANPCGPENPCPEGVSCVNGACMPEMPQPPTGSGCGGGGACPMGVDCVNGMCCLDQQACFPPPTTCGDGICPPTFQCQNDQCCPTLFGMMCLPPLEACDPAGNCAPGEMCLFGFCVPDFGGGGSGSGGGGSGGGGSGGGGSGGGGGIMMCMANSDCPSGQCVFGFCLPGGG